MTAMEVIRIEGQSEGYKRWIKEGSDALRERLPFKGPAHLAITIGSAGMESLVDAMDFEKPPVEIPFEEIGLPVGENQNHPKMILAGVTKQGKNIIVVKGRTHEYEIRPTGINTETWGVLGPAELTTGYLGMLSQIGVENMILTNAAGGINHPLNDDELKPYSSDDIPVISLIESDVDLAFQNANLGHYKGEVGDFFSLKNPDEELMQVFRQSMLDIDENMKIPTVHYATSLSTPEFEDETAIWMAAKFGAQAVGMSYSPEKQFLSGVKGIGRFIGISIITNLQELGYKDGREGDEAISVQELVSQRPGKFKKKFIASDAEVRENSKKIEKKLSMALAQLAKNL